MIALLFALLFSATSQAKTLHIAVIDTGLPNFTTNAKICPNGVYDLTNTDVYDKLKHGTNILGIISDKLVDVDYCFYVIKIYDKEPQTYFLQEIKAILILNNLDYVDIVNYSSEGNVSNYIEKVLIERFIKYKNVHFVVAAGNSSKNLDKKCNAFPACYTGVISVGNGFNSTNRSYTSNYGKRVSVWRNGVNVRANGITMTGSSQSTAVYSGDLALELSKK
jgi:hypothetical protein